jgi:uncharacterized cupin superfamily protein
VTTTPHVHHASARAEKTVLFAREEPLAEMGLRALSPGCVPLHLATDELSYCLNGRAVLRPTDGDAIDIQADTAVHLKQGWNGVIDVAEPLTASYMKCRGGTVGTTPVLRQASTAGPLTPWATISTMIEGVSTTSGILMSKEPDRRAESGVWTCTPGIWICGVSRDEFCHFVAGRSTYTHSSGERIEIEPDTLACFPAGWWGVCEVHETVRKVYMIR